MSSATVETRTGRQNPIGSFWRGFRTFRRTRPFWGGLLAMIAGVPILYFPYAHLALGSVTIAMSTTAGAGSLLIGVLMIALGITGWFQKAVRVFAGIATILLTLVSIPMSNLAGFGLALLPGLIGGGLLVSWAPLPEPSTEAAEGHRGRRAGRAADPVAESVVAESAVAESVATEPAAAAEAPTAVLPAQGAPKAPATEAVEAAEAAAPVVPQQGGAEQPEEAR
ncbi:DUF6114 domain-containing protein [Kitasatospora sp. SUK 42]|uniref:DUF6114 domain-containing protein n=1 Tax=Kitasatospora sp. SUK 42 TaxID=1588882 RepID=UPI0018C995C0|nr:DUF6114 domain-containing protein [Kitasatospora sp. SUK 42]MBV2151924.1 hypothetical protein [Kitasatospora sp. SUK 42]